MKLLDVYVQYTHTKHKISGDFWSHIAHTLTICYRMCSIRLLFVTVCALRSVRLLFFAAYLEYANKANHMLILPFQLNQVKTYEKSENRMCGDTSFTLALRLAAPVMRLAITRGSIIS